MDYYRSQSRAASQPKNPGIKPLPAVKTILYGVIPALILYLTHYYLVPYYVECTGIPYFKGYLAGYVLTMGLFFSAALIAFLLEGNPRSWEALKSRYRLAKMNRGDWLWVMGMIAVTFLAYFGLSFTGNWVQSVPFLAPREAWPAEFGPGGTYQLVSGEFMGLSITGQWWVIGVYFLGWFLNIFGEEFWFRGYILPRQEMAFGKRAWLANGLMFTFNHLWQPWIMIAILPVSLLLVYVVQRRRNTWIGIIQ
ncbi:MAG: CPBP family intramembrane glutamic endopeptidase, partial [Anaerolineales bacterium]